ncbi:MarR family transcriptional regulator [Paracoccus spongiarum]|uniref:Helix-turn-helix domain-containing protein n=1 Tax=Paracoccus spongiarum TaxID=3064387 RepID=A0ABT9JHH0_9RHOB|nr:MarR family transcriptional regulator [Paracoccus sp. 2205BS29-5]MDP5309268.1 helix-turn-helix domain-containing protein [Paracoccus sp. 2205BS29-5]
MLREMEAAIGADAVRDFLLAHGGRDFSIPARHQIDTTPGRQMTATDWLVGNYGWGRIVPPKGPVAHRFRVSFTVLALRREGRSIGQIATALGIHSRSVSKILQRLATRGLLTQPPT